MGVLIWVGWVTRSGKQYGKDQGKAFRKRLMIGIGGNNRLLGKERREKETVNVENGEVITSRK